jgi:uncharacterized membrane protein
VGNESFKETVDTISKVIDGAGVAVVVIGLLIATTIFLAALRARTDADLYRIFRQQVGKAILLGLEFLVAADIIRTVAVTPNAQSVAVLAGIVAIRTFLSFSLELEITGKWPWQKQPRTGADAPDPAAA